MDKSKTSWDDPNSDPLQDIIDVMQREFDRGIQSRSSYTIHHPKCKCLETGNLVDCNCGGWIYSS